MPSLRGRSCTGTLAGKTTFAYAASSPPSRPKEIFAAAKAGRGDLCPKKDFQRRAKIVEFGFMVSVCSPTHRNIKTELSPESNPENPNRYDGSKHC
jgi:hypothetical protein